MLFKITSTKTIFKDIICKKKETKPKNCRNRYYTGERISAKKILSYYEKKYDGEEKNLILSIDQKWVYTHKEGDWEKYTKDNKGKEQEIPMFWLDGGKNE